MNFEKMMTAIHFVKIKKMIILFHLNLKKLKQMKIDVCSLIENADKLGILKEEMKGLKRISYSLNNEILSEN